MERQFKFYVQKLGLNVVVDGIGLVYWVVEIFRYKIYVIDSSFCV